MADSVHKVLVKAHRPTQSDRVLEQLHADRSAGHGTCGVALHTLHILRYAARIWELRHARGCVIEERPCRRHAHESAIAEYTLVLDPATDQPQQLRLGAA